VAAEVWTARGEPAAADRIRQLRASLAGHLWAAPCLLRAEGRLRRDPDLLRAAADGFAAIDARFEEAVTLTMVDDTRAEGRARLRALGCAGPALP